MQKQVIFSRFGGMLKQGWLGYNLNEKDQSIGLTQVPWYSTIQLSQLVFNLIM
jgi:hypothetical protein